MESFLRQRASDPRFRSGLVEMRTPHNVTSWEPLSAPTTMHTYTASADTEKKKDVD